MFTLYLDTKTTDAEVWKKMVASLQKILHRTSVAEGVYVCLSKSWGMEGRVAREGREREGEREGGEQLLGNGGEGKEGRGR
jgi:hypothetical protein